MTITGTTVVKGVLVLMSVVLLISFFSEGFVFNGNQKSIMMSIFLLALPLYLDKEKKQRTTKKRTYKQRVSF
jgi:hypothetical protein